MGVGNDGDIRTARVGLAARVWCEDLTTGTLTTSGAYIMTLCYDGSMQRVNTLYILYS